MISVKRSYEEGNIQFTMAKAKNANGSCFLLDCDMDEHNNALEHLADVFTHVFTGGTHRMWKLFRWTVRSRLFLPIVYLLAILTPIAALIAVSPLLAVLMPAPIRRFLGSIWNSLTSSPAISVVLSVIGWLALMPATLVAYEVLRWMITPEETKEVDGLAVTATQLAQGTR